MTYDATYFVKGSPTIRSEWGSTERERSPSRTITTTSTCPSSRRTVSSSARSRARYEHGFFRPFCSFTEICYTGTYFLFNGSWPVFGIWRSKKKSTGTSFDELESVTGACYAPLVKTGVLMHLNLFKSGICCSTLVQCCDSVTFWYGSGAGSCYCCQWLSRWQTKIFFFFLIFYAYVLLFEATFISFVKEKSR